MITLSNLTFAYPGKKPVLENISLSVSPASHTALLGRNGVGKSTLALLVKGLLSPTSGKVVVDGFPTSDEKSRMEVMRRVGLVFQNPDDTIVATTVERELAFGLENLGVARGEMRRRVDEALARFRLERYRHTNPLYLSGGERQRLALAAVMIMEPSHLVLDEPTSLLDPWSRGDIVRLIREASEEGATVVHITQFASEARFADRVVILDENGICADGPPDEVLSAHPEFRPGSVGVPRFTGTGAPGTGTSGGLRSVDGNYAVAVIEDVAHVYGYGTPFAIRALDGVGLRLPRESSTVLVGPSGSGKTTLLEIASGVTRPTEGSVHVPHGVVRAMAFQFPEDQMFGDTVEDYVAFGPGNLGKRDGEVDEAVDGALEAVGLDPSIYRHRDPFSLSGGEKRRAALAGVLAMNPDVLILDEPFAGLDREGVELLTASLGKYIGDGGTLLFSTHDFDAALGLADRAIVLEGGRITVQGPARDILHGCTERPPSAAGQ